MTSYFIYADEYSSYDYGPTHPMKPIRLKLTHDLIRAYGLFDIPTGKLVEAEKADEDDILSFHTKQYIDILKRANQGSYFSDATKYGLGPGDNPIFKGVYDFSLLSAGASLQAAKAVESGEANIAFNIAGGLHHASANRSSGFCYIDDPVVAIHYLLKKGLKVAYIDIDAHHGDGVQYAFYATDRVLTISIHESGGNFFPGTGFEDEIGVGDGLGYCVNVPLNPESDDEVFLWAFEGVVPTLMEAYEPDVVVSQLGVDTMRTDPLAHLNLTTNGFAEMVERIKRLSPKWIALGGGGYNVANVPRCWTLAWSIMNEVVPEDDLPDRYRKIAWQYGYEDKKLRDEPFNIDNGRAMAEAEKVVRFLKYNVFSILGA